MPWHDPTLDIMIDVEPRHGVAHDHPYEVIESD